MRLRRHPSPNFGDRRQSAIPDLIVLHYTAMTSCDAALQRLCDPDREVSAHYLIGRDGAVFGMVDEDKRAWHAGSGAWGPVSDINSRSIGIELDNDGFSPFGAGQMAALEDLLADIMARRSIPPERVIAHSDMAPERKRDPGPRFDWRRLALAGLSVWPEWGDASQDFLRSALAFGYPDHDREILLDTFRSRFRPTCEGPEADEDRAMMADLAARYPVRG